ncbi:NAD(P)/FAD-dependent oxidoreductase [Acuticoccus sp.]|uniref:NAD(P)/FAD-dependent oxidoreductase n=1 Tax=Acuticoccus sp. TaxID=1904378 RepID=UPI003B515F17
MADGTLWRATAAEAFEGPPLEGDADADLAIVGGGYTGCAAALAAAERGASVRLLEAERVGHGGSGRNVGLVNAGLWLPPDDVEAALGPEEGRALNDALAGAPDLVFELIARHGIACEPRRAGTLHCAHAPSAHRELKRRHRQLAGRGAPVALLDASEARRRTGSDAVHGALFDARAGTIQPLAYCRGLARAARDAGAVLHEESPVRSVARTAGGWRVATDRGSVRAKALLVATNAYGHPAALAGAVVPLRYFQLATTPLGDNVRATVLPGGEGAWDTGTVMSSFRTDAVGRLLVGGVGSLAGPGGAVHRRWADRTLARLFPQLAGTPFEHALEGRIAMTRDHVPKIVRLGPAGAMVFGYSGRGIGPGTVFGTRLAHALLSGDEAALPVRPRARHAEPFAALRGIGIEAGATLAHAVAGSAASARRRSITRP